MPGAPKIHFESIRRRGGITITSTLCNRMVCHGDINSSGLKHEVSCRICLKLLKNVKREAA
jgi:hypothetical protein